MNYLLPLGNYFVITSIFTGSRRILVSRSQWPRGLRRRSAAARLLRLWVRFPPGAWMFVSCECGMLSSRGLLDELITRPDESYRLWCVVVCDLETSCVRRTWPTGAVVPPPKKILVRTQCSIMCYQNTNNNYKISGNFTEFMTITYYYALQNCFHCFVVLHCE